MCQIVRTSYNNGSMVVEVSSSGKSLMGFVFELYLFDFYKGEYSSKASIRQKINNTHIAQFGGNYRFEYRMPSNCKMKYVICNDEKSIVLGERFIGDKHKIRVGVEPSDIGYLYKIKSDVSVCRNLIYYKSPVSSTKINLPDNLNAGETLMFTIKEKNFRPKFEFSPEIAECFIIEG